MKGIQVRWLRRLWNRASPSNPATSIEMVADIYTEVRRCTVMLYPHSLTNNQGYASLQCAFSFYNISVTSPTSQHILQPFRRFIYATAHSPTLPLLHLRHCSFSNPSLASPTSQALHVIHLASRPCDLVPWLCVRGPWHPHSLWAFMSCNGDAFIFTWILTIFKKVAVTFINCATTWILVKYLYWWKKLATCYLSFINPNLHIVNTVSNLIILYYYLNQMAYYFDLWNKYWDMKKNITFFKLSTLKTQFTDKMIYFRINNSSCSSRFNNFCLSIG